MGMYSTYLEDDIEIVDQIGLRRMLDEKNLDTLDLINCDSNKIEIDFYNWTDDKIEGYWYAETVNILTLIAPFIRGTVTFEYEEGYKFKIIFRDGKVFTSREEEVVYSNEEELKPSEIF